MHHPPPRAVLLSPHQLAAGRDGICSRALGVTGLTFCFWVMMSVLLA